MCVCAFLRPEAFSSFLLYCRSNDIYIASRRSYRVRVLPLSRIFPSLPRRVGSSSFLDCPTLGVLSIPPLSILYIKRRRRMKRERGGLDRNPPDIPRFWWNCLRLHHRQTTLSPTHSVDHHSSDTFISSFTPSIMDWWKSTRSVPQRRTHIF